jgi:hypothetical protein
MTREPREIYAVGKSHTAQENQEVSYQSRYTLILLSHTPFSGWTGHRLFPPFRRQAHVYLVVGISQNPAIQNQLAPLIPILIEKSSMYVQPLKYIGPPNK